MSSVNSHMHEKCLLQPSRNASAFGAPCVVTIAYLRARAARDGNACGRIRKSMLWCGRRSWDALLVAQEQCLVGSRAQGLHILGRLSHLEELLAILSRVFFLPREGAIAQAASVFPTGLRRQLVADSLQIDQNLLSSVAHCQCCVEITPQRDHTAKRESASGGRFPLSPNRFLVKCTAPSARQQ